MMTMPTPAGPPEVTDSASVTKLMRRFILPAALLLVAVLGLLVEAAYQRSTLAMRGLEQRSMARGHVQSVLTSMSEAEAAQRGYLLTGQKSYLEPMAPALRDMRASLDWLAAAYASDAELLAAFQRMRKAADEKAAVLLETRRLFDEAPPNQWRELLLTGIGRDRMQDARAAANEVLAIEWQRVAIQRGRLQAVLDWMRGGVHAVLLCGLAGVYLAQRKVVTLSQRADTLTQALAAERDHLEAEVSARTAQLSSLTRHLDTAREDERAHLARELHDELGALLTAAKLDVARLRRTLNPITPEASDRLQHLTGAIDEGIKLKRRIIEDLRPSSLSNLGLEPALKILLSDFAQRTGLEIQSTLEPVALSDRSQLTVYRLLQEALTNIAKHASPTRIEVSLNEHAGRVSVSISDNGRGFDPRRTSANAYGLLGMRFRVESDGGQLLVESSPGAGTALRAWLPVSE